MVARLNYTWVLLIIYSIVTLFLFAYILISKKNNKSLSIGISVINIFIIILGWTIWNVKHNELINKTSNYIKTVELESYYGKDGCMLSIQKDFSYTIETKQGDTIKQGSWDIYETPTIILLDGNLLGTGQFKLSKQ